MTTSFIIYAAVAVGFCLVAKMASGVILDVGVYGHGAFRSIVPLLLYEVFVVPVVFGLGLFRRSIMWKGRRYRLGPRGMVLGLENLD